MESIINSLISRKHLFFPPLFLLCLFVLTLPQVAFAQTGNRKDTTVDSLSRSVPPLVKTYPQPLFQSSEILELTLEVSLRNLLRDRGDERDYHQAVLTYLDPEGKPVPVELKVRVRGNNRRDPQVCSFPPLRLNFPTKKMEGTIFSGQDKLKLVTHCRNDEYVLREYKVYKIYNLISEQSFKVRLCRITYKDADTQKMIESKYAFLIEDEDEMAARNSGLNMPPEIRVNMDYVDQKAMLTLAMFQYMIGNTDWSIPYRHNIKVLSVPNHPAPFPVPFDFDYAGIVSTPYAKPPPELGITSVRQRLFRGYCFTDSEFKEAIARFNEVREDVYQLYLQNKILSPAYIRTTTAYLDAFYKTINNPKSFKAEIIRMCQSNEKFNVVVKGLK
jgi:hypothetical protein